MGSRSGKRHRWHGPKLDRTGREQICEDCGAVKRYFAADAAKPHGVITCGRSTALYRFGDVWAALCPPCK